jgi:hypothetical protein
MLKKEKEIFDMVFYTMDDFGIRYDTLIDTIVDDFYILSNQFSFEKKFFYLSYLECENSFQYLYLCGIEFLFIDIEFSFIFEINK